MIPPEDLRRRREALLDGLEGPAILFAGGPMRRNADNEYSFRADSNFLFLLGPVEPEAAALFDPEDRSVTLFLPERTEARALWMGTATPFAEMGERLCVDRVLPAERLREEVAGIANGRPVGSLAIADRAATALARKITGEDLDPDDPDRLGTPWLLERLAALRIRKTPAELAEIRRAGEITGASVAAAMRATAPGVSEHEIAALVEHGYARNGAVAAFETILTARGEILHNHDHSGTLAEGDLVLLDTGAEAPSGWCADVSRTWPASGQFSPEQRDVYSIVLRALETVIEQMRPGVSWMDLHLAAGEIVAEGLVDVGVLKGSPTSLVERGTAFLFLPHGLGHHLGLDPHDLEAFGDRVLYPAGRPRRPQFGLANLRTDVDLEPGMVLTVEPGLYFVPAILRGLRDEHSDALDWGRIERFLDANGGRGFGGVRIEDDVAVTETGATNLTAEIPRQIGEIEALVGAGSTVPAGNERR